MVACLTKMPNVTGRMIDWWFSWHGTTERYKLWHPEAHVFCRWERRYPGNQTPPDYKDYIGYTSQVSEYIGRELTKLNISFIDPSKIFETSKFEESGISTAICARTGLRDKPIDAGWLIHLIRNAGDGIEMRSRFWLGDFHLRIPGLSAAVDHILNTETSRKRLITYEFSKNLCIHCAQEMNHLAGFLPELYRKETGLTA